MFRHIQNNVALPMMPAPAFGQTGTSNSEVHNSGEVWTSALWECYVALLKDTGRYTFAQASQAMREYLVASLKLTPINPTMIEARDAVLLAALALEPVAALAGSFLSRLLGKAGPPRYADGEQERYATDLIDRIEQLVGMLTRTHGPAPNVVAASPPASQPAPALAAPAPAGVRIAVLPIDPGNTHDPLLARGLTETLCDALERVPEFIVTGLASSRVAAETAHDPRELARMLGTDHLLRASLVADDGQLELRLQLLAARDGSVLWSEAYRRPREQLLDVLAPALVSMQRTLLPNSDGVNADPDLGNSGAAALAIYWSASRGKATTREQRIETLAQLRRAVAENPQDALGWTAIAIVERTRYMYGEGSFADTLGAARSAILWPIAPSP